MNAKYKVSELLAKADIDIINNSDKQTRPWDIGVTDDRFYSKVMQYGSLGLGEAYLEGWWECEELDNFFRKILETKLQSHIKWSDIIFILKSRLFNFQSISRAFKVGKCHYDIGNDLYQHMLDKRMVYTCGYWKDANNLDEAQEAKLELICKKMDLQPGLHILDIGCGWGSFAKYAAEKYNVKVTGVTVSKEQVKLGRELCNGYDVSFRLMDYRELARNNELFDRIVSIGMFEHVGLKNYRKFMETVNHCIAPDGIFLLHTIGNNESVHFGEPFLDKYIFPNGMIPSLKQISKSVEGLFAVENLQNIGLHYDKTLMSWYNNFEESWTKLRNSSSKYDDKFYRMWKYYLLSCAGAFRARHLHVWQIVLSKLCYQNMF